MKIIKGLLIALIAGSGLSSGTAHAATIVLFTADTDNTGGTNPIGVPANNNPNIPSISSGVTLNPGTALFNGEATGPLNGITYGPGAFSGNTGGTTGFVNSSYTFSTGGTYNLVWEVANVRDTAFSSALGIDNVTLNGSSLYDFESGISSDFTVLGTAGTSGAVSNLAPTEGSSFAFLDTTGNYRPIYDTVNGTNGSRLISSAFSVNAGDVLSLDIAFLSNDGASFPDYGIATVTNDPIPDPTLVPEPSHALTPLALGAFGAGWMLKRKLRQKQA